MRRAPGPVKLEEPRDPALRAGDARGAAAPHYERLMTPELTDAELTTLAQRASQGDIDALERLFLALLPRVRNLVRYLVRGDRDVDDLSQEALLHLLRGLGTYRGEGEFRAWVDRVVARSVFASRRHRERATDWDMSSDELTPTDSGALPDAECARRQLAACLDTLPDAQRGALVSHHVLGMTVPEVSAALGISEETVRSRLRLGKERLKRLLGIARWRKVG